MKAEDIKKDDGMRIYFEALLLDPTTPAALYRDLFGIDEIEVDRYRVMYYREWEMSRVPLMNHIQKIKNAKERDIKENVFFHGWEVIAALFNQGAYINAGKTIDKIVRTLLGRLTYIMSAKTINRNTVNMIKDLIKMLKDAQVETESATLEQWDIIFNAMQEGSTEED